jgi:hypothetical protein
VETGLKRNRSDMKREDTTKKVNTTNKDEKKESDVTYPVLHI